MQMVSHVMSCQHPFVPSAKETIPVGMHCNNGIKTVIIYVPGDHRRCNLIKNGCQHVLIMGA